jgi:hypothetical protein
MHALSGTDVLTRKSLAQSKRVLFRFFFILPVGNQLSIGGIEGHAGPVYISSGAVESVL